MGSVGRNGKVVIQRYQGQLILMLNADGQMGVMTAPVVSDFQLRIEGFRSGKHGNAGLIGRGVGKRHWSRCVP